MNIYYTYTGHDNTVVVVKAKPPGTWRMHCLMINARIEIIFVVPFTKDIITTYYNVLDRENGKATVAHIDNDANDIGIIIIIYDYVVRF